MKAYKKPTQLKGSNQTSAFACFIILIFTFLLSNEVGTAQAFLKVLDCILFFSLVVAGVIYSIKILRNSIYFHNWKAFSVAIFLMLIYLVLFIKVIILLKGGV